MSIELKVVANCDDVYLVWRPRDDIPNCLGFAIWRKRNGQAPELLKNRVGFAAGAAGDHVPQGSDVLPFQRLDWTDHGGNTGDTLSYRVVAMVGQPGSLKPGPASGWSDEITLTTDCGNGLSAYFNRGIVLSQVVGRLMKEHDWKADDIKKHASFLEDPLRDFLGGDLRQGLVALLANACTDASLEIYAALFEASDKELTDKLVVLGPRLHIVLGNGAIKKAGEDENAETRNALSEAGAEVFDRMSAPRFLAHNKFLVICRKGHGKQVPLSVWTGSTNWQPTGLCTQVNNGILIENAAVAGDYLDAWERLRDAGNASTAELKDANSRPPTMHRLDGKGPAVNVSARFTATRSPVDLDELHDIINGAKKSILFEMFMPGNDIFGAVQNRQKDLFVRGVVNSFPQASKYEKQVEATLVGGTDKEKTFSLEVVEPQGIAHPFASWVTELTRKGFNRIGHAIIHSKLLVVDANTEHPIVVTGSHNFSASASQHNDENFVVIRGSRKLALAYAVNCMAVYDHYRWRAYLLESEQAGKQPWEHLDDASDWLARYQQSPARQKLLEFWLG